MRMCYRGGKNPEYQKRPAGEIFHTIKFCDYYSFEYMEEKKNPDLPILKIETDTTRQNSGQLKTRLEAFREELGMSQISSIRVSDPDRVYVAGIDSGSASTDAVVMGPESQNSRTSDSADRSRCGQRRGESAGTGIA